MSYVEMVQGKTSFMQFLDRALLWEMGRGCHVKLIIKLKVPLRKAVRRGNRNSEFHPSPAFNTLLRFVGSDQCRVNRFRPQRERIEPGGIRHVDATDIAVVRYPH